MKTTYGIKISSSLVATVTLTGIGQQAPREGDNIIVSAAIALPAEGEVLALEIQFGARCPVAGEPLHSRWGFPEKGLRISQKIFSAATFAAARKAANAWAKTEVGKLQAALSARAAALVAAGDWE